MRRALEVGNGNIRKRVYPEPSLPRPTPGRKDTKRWCRGKAGVEHVKAWVPDQRLGLRWWNFQCTSCGRLFGWCAAFGGTCRCGHH